MRHPRSVPVTFALLAAVALAACEAPFGPGTDDPREKRPSVTESELTFVRFAPDAPALVDTIVSFWAVRGENRRVEVRYVPTAAYPNGGVCLEFRVPGDALLRHPDGRTVQPGDSVHITIRVVNTAEFKFEFAPAGLQFDPGTPAELRIHYYWADRDYNGDGVIDSRDEEMYQSFAIWRQERVGEPWSVQVGERDQSSEKIKASISGFTRYALASN